MPLEELKHACGLFAIYAPKMSVAWMTAQALDGQQTRGQEGAGIATTDGDSLYLRKGRGFVTQVFRTPRSVRRLVGHAAIGHNRYSTTGRDKSCNVQPLRVSGPNGEICLGHNGNLVNARQLRRKLEAKGETFETTTDSELIAKLLVNESGPDWASRLKKVMYQLDGSYCLAILTKDGVLLARDPTGNRPLSVGHIDGCWAAASESGVFANQGIEFEREVNPGEIVVFDRDGMHSFQALPAGPLGVCWFEYIYFARPDTVIEGVQCHGVRFRAGQILAREHPAEADFVAPVPRSGLYASDGYTFETGIPVNHGIISNLLSRAFIDPDKIRRVKKLELKYSTTIMLRDKRLVVIDDSIVRGNSNNRVARLLHKEGVSETHMRISSPPITKPCHWGIDMATEAELVAARIGGAKEEIEKTLAATWQVDSVRYLTVEQLVEAIGLTEEKLCLHCVGGRSALTVPERFRKEEFEKVPVAAG